MVTSESAAKPASFNKFAKGFPDGEISNVVIRVNGFNITTRGFVVNGAPKLGTAFIRR